MDAETPMRDAEAMATAKADPNALAVQNYAASLADDAMREAFTLAQRCAVGAQAYAEAAADFLAQGAEAYAATPYGSHAIAAEFERMAEHVRPTERGAEWLRLAVWADVLNVRGAFERVREAERAAIGAADRSNVHEHGDEADAARVGDALRALDDAGAECERLRQGIEAATNAARVMDARQRTHAAHNAARVCVDIVERCARVDHALAADPLGRVRLAEIDAADEAAARVPTWANVAEAQAERAEAAALKCRATVREYAPALYAAARTFDDGAPEAGDVAERVATAGAIVSGRPTDREWVDSFRAEGPRKIAHAREADRIRADV